MIRNTVSIAAFLVLAGAASGAAACSVFYLPDLDLSTSSTAYTGIETTSFMITPDGWGGDLMSNAFLPDGTRVDATITVQVLTPTGNPYVGYCQEDIELRDDGGLAFCPNGNLPLSAADAAGNTTFSRPFFGGGNSSGLLRVYLQESPLQSSWGHPIRINSPDINGDLRVDLTDVPLFAADFHGAYDYRSDFHHEGQINLSDLVRMAGALGADCP